MENPELQELTASEPLTLEQEYEMQSGFSHHPAMPQLGHAKLFVEKWREDEDSVSPAVLVLPAKPAKTCG